MKKRLLSLVLCLVMVFSLVPVFELGALADNSYKETQATNWTAARTNNSETSNDREYYAYDATDDAYYRVQYAKEPYFLSAGSEIEIYGNFSKDHGGVWPLGSNTYGSLSQSDTSTTEYNQELYYYLGQANGTSNGTMRAVYYNSTPKIGYYGITLFYYTNATNDYKNVASGSVSDKSSWNTAKGNGTITMLGSSSEWHYGWAMQGEGVTNFGEGSYKGTLYYKYTDPANYNAMYYTRADGTRVDLATPKINSDGSTGYTGSLYYVSMGDEPDDPEPTGTPVDGPGSDPEMGVKGEHGEIMYPDEVADNGVVLSKRIRQEADGTYTLVMEAYAQGEITQVNTDQKTEYILLLDYNDQIKNSRLNEWVQFIPGTSGTSKETYWDACYFCPDKGTTSSCGGYQNLFYLDDEKTGGTSEYCHVEQIDAKYFDSSLFAKATDKKTVKAQADEGFHTIGLAFKNSTGKYYLVPGTYWLEKDSSTHPIWRGIQCSNSTTFYYSRGSTNANVPLKRTAMKNAAIAFLDTVKEQPNASVAVVGYGQGPNSTQGRLYGRTMNTTLLKPSTGNNLTTLKNYVNDTKTYLADGNSGTGSRAASGLNTIYTGLGYISPSTTAKTSGGTGLFTNASATDGTTRVVILFHVLPPNRRGTDSASNYYKTGADNAIEQARLLKNKGVKIYSIGLFAPGYTDTYTLTDANKNVGDYTLQNYLNYVSSNYSPSGTSASLASPGSKVASKYAMEAADQTTLSNEFKFVTQDAITSTVNLGTSTVLKDVITENLNYSNASVTVQTSTLQTRQATNEGGETYTQSYWADPVTEAGVTGSISGNTVTATGFDYSGNSVVPSGTTVGGKKIVVTVTGLTGNSVGVVPTNTDASGIYKSASDADAFEKFAIPTVYLEGCTVTWKNYDGTTLETDGGVRVNTQPSYDGATPTKPATREYNYVFDGWSTDPNAQQYGDSVADLPRVTEDVTYYAIFQQQDNPTYTVYWANYNGSVLSTDPGYYVGQTPARYAGTTPYRPNDGDTYYDFAGWSRTQGSTTVENDIPSAITGDVTYYAVYTQTTATPRTVCIEYTAEYKLDTGVSELLDVDEHGGSFSYNNTGENPLYFAPQADKDKEGRTFDLTGFGSVSTAVYKKDAAYKKVSVVPAGSVYVDDDLLGAVVTESSSTVNSTYAENAKANTTEGRYTITFVGTGIDVYCTTDSSSRWIQAKLDGANIKTMSNKAENTRYNVPTISYTCDYGEHTLTLNVLSTSDYKLDGICVYNTISPAKQSVYDNDDAKQEMNAYFKNLHKLLVNVGQTYQSNNNGTMGGILFLDGTSDKITKNDAGQYIVKNNAGEEKTLYANDFAAYSANSPSNEIYLSNGQAITFTLTGYNNLDNGAKVMIGMSTAKKGQTASITGIAEGSVSSPLDQYYTLDTVDATDGASKTFVIVNNSDSGVVVSITNLKITGNSKPVTISDGLAVTLSAEEAELASTLAVEPVELQLVVNEDTLLYAAKVINGDIDEPEAPSEPETPTKPDQPSTPSFQNLFQQLFSSFVQNLFKSISRLFGK